MTAALQWGTVGISSIAALRDADTLVTDSGLREDIWGRLAEQVGELALVEVERR